MPLSRGLFGGLPVSFTPLEGHRLLQSILLGLSKNLENELAAREDSVVLQSLIDLIILINKWLWKHNIQGGGCGSWSSPVVYILCCSYVYYVAKHLLNALRGIIYDCENIGNYNFLDLSFSYWRLCSHAFHYASSCVVLSDKSQVIICKVAIRILVRPYSSALSALFTATSSKPGSPRWIYVCSSHGSSVIRNWQSASCCWISYRNIGYLWSLNWYLLTVLVTSTSQKWLSHHLRWLSFKTAM